MPTSPMLNHADAPPEEPDLRARIAALLAQNPLTQKQAQTLGRLVAASHMTAPACYAYALVAALSRRIETTWPPANTADTTRARLIAALERLTPFIEQRTLSGAVRSLPSWEHTTSGAIADVPRDAFDDLTRLLTIIMARKDIGAANAIFNAYLSESPLGQELEGLSVLPLFFTLAQAELGAEQSASAAGQSPNTAPHLVCIGGFSGSGKSTLARALAPSLMPHPGALVLRSDVERKRLFGVDEAIRLSDQHYSQNVSDEVYRQLLNKATRTLNTGHSVVVDAVFAKHSEREAFAQVAAHFSATFNGIWLDAPADTLIERVSQRTDDASDADEKVVLTQLSYKLGTITWPRVNARGAAASTEEAARALLFPQS